MQARDSHPSRSGRGYVTGGPSRRIRRSRDPGLAPPYPSAVTLSPGPALAACARAIREVAANPGIRRIEAAWTIGIAADWAYLIVLLIVAYTAGGAIGVGILGVVRMVPPALIGPFADVPVARFRGDRTLVAVNLIRAGGAVATAVVLAIGA